MSEENNTVVEYLEMAVQAAQEQEMSASELIGLLFYYAHNVAQETRELGATEPARSTRT